MLKTSKINYDKLNYSLFITIFYSLFIIINCTNGYIYIYIYIYNVQEHN